MYTYNQSTLYLLDEEEQDIDARDFETTYNYNERQNKWEKDKNGWETVEFTARAYGGRPQPVFKWYFENNDNDDLENEDSNMFRVQSGSLGCEDRGNYICNYESTVTFTIDENLMEFFETQGIDPNPKDGTVRAELNCEIQQGDNAFIDKVYVTLNIEKSYDNGALASDTIGIIVGVVVAVLLLVLVIGLLLFAKASNRWCFANEYREPGQSKPHSAMDQGRGQRSHSHDRGRGGGGGGGGGHHQQVHRFTFSPL